MPLFQKAERSQAKARIALMAPAGYGKTHSALLMAAGLGKKIAVIDTENGSASMEVGKPGIPSFDVAVMHAPYTVEKYLSAIKEAEDAGYDVIVLDSLSHSWAGSGGLLDQQGAIADKGGNSFAAWRTISPKGNALIDAILQSPAHVIATMRSKVDYAMEGGKVMKLGLAPVVREGTDYEFGIVLDIDKSHKAHCSKDRTGLFDGKITLITKDTGKAIKEWLESADPIKEIADNIHSG